MRFAALLNKELREGLRAGWANIPAAALATVLLLSLSKTGSSLVVFLPLIAMPFHAGTVLSRSIQTERLRGGLLPLLIYGGSPAEVWMAKVLGAFLLAYATMLLSLVAFAAWIAPPPLAALPHILFTMPLASLSLIGIEGLLFWTLGHSSLLTTILPLALLFGTSQLVARFRLGPLTASSIVATIAVSLTLFALLTLAVTRYPRERLAAT